MQHTFLLQPGRWLMEGMNLEGEGLPVPFKGRMLIGWSQDGFWFTIASQLTFPTSVRQPYTLTYKGRFNHSNRKFNFYFDHSEIGRMEGEGWVNHHTISQRFRLINSERQLSGFEVLYQQASDRYLWCRTMLAGDNVERVLEGNLQLVKEL